MNLEGALHIVLALDGGRPTARLNSSRPQIAPRLLAGKTVTEGLNAIPLLFAVCARAQAAAAWAACQAAKGADVDAQAMRTQSLRVRIEAALEHAWRLLLDWPSLLGLPQDPVTLAGLRKRVAALRTGEDEVGVDLTQLLRLFLTQQVLGMAPGEWLDLDLNGLRRWAAAGETNTAAVMGTLWQEAPWGQCDVPLLTELDGPAWSTLQPALAQPDFPEQPHWQGIPRETGALARTRHHPAVAAMLAEQGISVGARVLARVVELAQLATGQADALSWITAEPMGRCAGAAVVQCARGALTHYVELDGDRLKRYVVVAPTEWNFHPEGAFRKACEGLNISQAAGLEVRARQLALALDPCVPVTMVLRDRGIQDA